MNPLWLLRMSKWARNPPSDKRVALVFVVIAICLALFAYEYFFGAPDWMKVERVKRP
ncbi:hypothetical protein [Aliiroseovarius sp. PrR006]|uniref:hypothetical protein n=1 Tax=Aliiroseovarius sp. PrR006 TaxID=2706883 RepID=UPI00194364A2|nr:hypothetical protein [Aliiroseovarius sp. PrR006]